MILVVTTSVVSVSLEQKLEEALTGIRTASIQICFMPANIVAIQPVTHTQ